MEDTGRIRKLLAPEARRILFSQSFGPEEQDELRHISEVDQAHLLMLAECGIVQRDRAAQLLAAIGRLRAERFAPLWQRASTRGLFLLYEDYLIETEGAETGGILQTARSRNDLNATVLKLRLRGPYLALLEQALRFHAILLRRAKQYANVVMPVYTHGQAAMPTTYGHYLAAVASALGRDLGWIIAAAHGMQSSPLGAGAAVGTSFPIRPARTAALLGFDSWASNSLDAVASRDLALRLLAAAATYGATLSRLATDLMQWTTVEFGFLQLPDELVGSSSAMPQKRNPFLLEHVQGRAASLLGAFVQAGGAMHATPFTNCVAVGTEAMKPLHSALRNLKEMIVLMRLNISGAQLNREAMLQRVSAGFTTATAFADRLVAGGKVDFRTAHHVVGTAVRKTLEDGNHSFAEVAGACAKDQGIAASFHDLDPASVVQKLEFGGGPGNSSLKYCLDRLREEYSVHYRGKQRQQRQWQAAQAALREAVAGFTRSTQRAQAPPDSVTEPEHLFVQRLRLALP